MGCRRMDRTRAADAGRRRRPPLQVPAPAAPGAAEPQLQAVHGQVAKDRVRGPEFLELLEDQPDHSPRLLVRLLGDLSGGHLEVPDRDGQEQLAALRFVPAATEQAVPQGHQFVLAHGAAEAQKETVVAVQGIVHGVLVAQERVEDAAHVNELVPIRVGPRQTAELECQHNAHVVEAHLRHQTLEPRPVVGGPAAPPRVLVDDDDALGRPAQALGELGQGVLPLPRLAVLHHLLR
jgi:hypothetical protein